MQTRLEHIQLKDIAVSETNVMFRDDAELTNDALQELIDSVKEKGVIQPVLLRPHPDKKIGYQLICGERRYRASLAADLKSIPANIREMSDEEAFECQVTENLQRKDVHPLKEAKAYKYLVDKDPAKNTAAELALRFGKNEKYVLHRLKLNDLIPAAAKDFASNRMTLGHALILARLTPEDQEEVIERHRDREDGYDTVASMEWTIENSIIRNLSSAPFKKDDAELYPKAGACTTCPKRSGANQLFADIKNKDRCFDQACFFTKLNKFVAVQVQATIETRPEVHFLLDYRTNPDPDIEKVLSAHKIKPLTHNDFQTYSGYSKDSSFAKIKGLWISGDKIGQEQVVYSTKQKAPKSAKKQVANGSVTLSKAEVKETISGIQQRMKRAAELDQEKVYVRVIEALKKSDPFTKVTDVKATKTDEVMAVFLMLEHGGYSTADKFRKMLKLPSALSSGKNWKADYIEALENLSWHQKLSICRIVMLDQFARQATNVNTVEGQLLMRAAKEYGGVDVDAFEREQKEIADKREARAKQRIKELQASVKAAPAKTKPAGKKASKKAEPAAV